MKHSTDRILTTHTGSLPRPMDLARILEAKDAGEVVDDATLAQQARNAVAEAVRKQVEAGIDVISDGEQGKVGYSTYPRHRLTGFGGTSSAPARADWADFPEAARKYGQSATVYRPACNAPMDWADPDAYKSDITNFQSAVATANPTEAFMTAASPGVIALFLGNEHYPTHEAYVGRLAELMKDEYEAIVEAGFLLQLDCPDFAMGRHMKFAHLTNQEFLRIADASLEALNHATQNIPADRMRLHLCWGNYEGPHHRDIPLDSVLPVALRARPQAISFEGANPRHEHEWAVFQEIKLPEDKVIIPGIVDSTTNFIEHPRLVAQRIERYARMVGRERVIAGSDCGLRRHFCPYRAHGGARDSVGQARLPSGGRPPCLRRPLVTSGALHQGASPPAPELGLGPAEQSPHVG